MPKLGMEPLRRDALETATIAEIGAAGTLDVTVSAIARRAGVSSALAHHYFGGKDQIFASAMRRILRDFGAEVRAALRAADTPQARAEALIEASFAASCFAPGTIRAWMTLYAQAPVNPAMQRLLRLYQRRLRSNLTHALRPLTPQPEAAAQMLGALIDGLYLRAALGEDPGAKDVALIALHRWTTP
ncbi:MAG: transcriptional regulator BetI [Pseudomonadota bacterium]